MISKNTDLSRELPHPNVAHGLKSDIMGQFGRGQAGSDADVTVQASEAGDRRRFTAQTALRTRHCSGRAP